MRSPELFDELKEKLELSSDYALAKKLGVSVQGISSARKRNTKPDPYTVFRAAELLKRDPVQMLAEAQLEGERSEEKKRFWERVKKAGATMAIAAIIATPKASQAIENAGIMTAKGIDALSIMRHS